MREQQIKYILFDLDGVLVDTRRVHFLALQAALRTHSIPLDEATHTRLYDGLPTKQKLLALARDYHISPEKMGQIDQAKQTKTVEMLTSLVKPDPKVTHIFAELKKAGFVLAICSNSRRASLDLVLRQMQLKLYLNFSLSNDDIETPKPSPEIYFLAMKRLKATAQECLIIEDSPHGIAAARASGAQLLVVKNSQELSLASILEACHE